MPTTEQLHILDSGAIKLIEYGDQLNRKLLGFLNALSRFIAGILIIAILLPFAFLVILITTVIARLSFEHVAFQLKKELKKVSSTDERELMESLLGIEELNSQLSQIQKGLNSTKLRKAYFTIFFGDSWKKCMHSGKRLQRRIENKVYPNLKDQPSEEQIQRLLKEYEGLAID